MEKTFVNQSVNGNSRQHVNSRNRIRIPFIGIRLTVENLTPILWRNFRMELEKMH